MQQCKPKQRQPKQQRRGRVTRSTPTPLTILTQAFHHLPRPGLWAGRLLLLPLAIGPLALGSLIGQRVLQPDSPGLGRRLSTAAPRARSSPSAERLGPSPGLAWRLLEGKNCD